jgi:hypothetical protein
MISSANRLCEHYKPKYSLKVYFEPKTLTSRYFTSVETSAPTVDIYLLRVDGTNRFTPAKFRINAAFVSTLKACKDKLSLSLLKSNLRIRTCHQDKLFRIITKHYCTLRMKLPIRLKQFITNTHNH